MKIFYKVSDKQLLNDRNEIFKEVGISALETNGFVPSVFKSSWNGEYNRSIKGYTYEYYKLKEGKYLEHIDISIVSGDKWIKVYLNIFELISPLNSIEELGKYEGINFSMPPSNLTKMRLRSDDYKGPPLFYMLFLPEHKIGSFYTKSGYISKVLKLKKLIESDMGHIDEFVKKWHNIYKANVTDWEGNIIKKI
ncbi:hypothetical protein D3C87_213020 [compost metagenome]